MSTVPLEPDDALVVLVTAPDRDVADALADRLVASGVAACVNLVPGVVSVYRWEGAVQRDEEWLLVIKTVRGRLRELERRLADDHPYDVPECVALAPEHVSGPYLGWLRAATAPRASS